MEHHHVRVKPIRIYSFYDTDRVTHARIVGYRLTCSCGERSPMRRSVREARESWRDHGVEGVGTGAT
jgi:hypothetical protein